MVERVKDVNTIIELLYAIEPLCYYFDMKPREFWNSTYREVNLYLQTHLVKIVDNLKREINLQEAVTNKLIRADSMSKRPKIIPIRDHYKELFNQTDPRDMSPKEITKRMREIMNTKNQ